jgi:hypothetical protein
MVTPFLNEQLADFVAKMIENSCPQGTAVDQGHVVGWCDMFLSNFTTDRMSELSEWSQWRLPKSRYWPQLLHLCLADAARYGLEKVELEVYSGNNAATSIYPQAGFNLEGKRSKTRKIDGRYQDAVLMGKSLEVGAA